MATKASKNQRVVKTASHPAASGERSYLIPLNKGAHAYVSVDGKIRHVATNSEAFVTAVRDLGPEAAPKVTAELERFAERFPDANWDVTLNRLRTAGVL